MDLKTHEVLWRGSKVTQGPVAGEGVVFVFTDDYRLQALAARTGKLLWERKLKEHPELFVHGRLLIVGGSKGVAAFHQATGKPIWTTADGTSARVAGSLVVARGQERLRALDAGTGKQRWEVKETGFPVSSAAGVFCEGDRSLVSLSPAAGSVLWHTKIGALDLRQHLLVRDGTVFVPSRDGQVTAVGPKGERSWEFAAGGSFSTVPVLCGSRLVAGCADGHIYALEAATGKEAWKTENSGEAGLATDGKCVYALQEIGPGGRLGILRAFSGEDGRELWKTVTPFLTGYHLDDRTLYLKFDADELRAVAVPSGTVRWSARAGGSLRMADGHVYALSDKLLEEFDPATGRSKWSTAVPPGLAGLRARGGLLLLDGQAACAVVDPTTGKLLWQVTRAQTFCESSCDCLLAPFVGGEDAVYYTDQEGLHALDLRTGQPRWTRPGFRCRPVLAKNRLYAVQERACEALDPATGKTLWSHPALSLAKYYESQGYEQASASADMGLRTPLVAGNRVAYVHMEPGGAGTSREYLFILDPETGQSLHQMVELGYPHAIWVEDGGIRSNDERIDPLTGKSAPAPGSAAPLVRDDGTSISSGTWSYRYLK